MAVAEVLATWLRVKLGRHLSGQGLVEYAMIIGLIAAVSIASAAL